MSVLKPIPADAYHVTPIITHKTQEYSYTFLGGANPSEISIDIATKPPDVWDFDLGVEPLNEDGILERNLYVSIRHMFYNSASVWNSGEQLTFPTSSQLYVINTGQQSYGDTVQPGSFSIIGGSEEIVDDRKGNLVLSGSTQVIGNVFYGLGIAVVPYSSGSVVNSFGMSLTSGSVVIVAFKASHTIYEHSIICTLETGELGYTFNPSLGSYSLDGNKISDSFASGTLSPYMTTVGLYNNNNELVAVAKFPRAIKRATESQQTVIVKFDA